MNENDQKKSYSKPIASICNEVKDYEDYGSISIEKYIGSVHGNDTRNEETYKDIQEGNRYV